jgi:WD40 repeat protein
MRHGLVLVLLCSPLLICLGCQENAKRNGAAQKGKTHQPPSWAVLVEKIALSPDGTKALFGYGSGLEMHKFTDWVKLWDLQKGKELCTLHGFTSTPRFLAFLPDGKTAVGGDYTGVLRFYEIPSGKFLRTLRVHAADLSPVNGVVLSPDGTVALTIGSEKNDQGVLSEPTFKVWDLVQDKLVRILEMQGLELYAISPDNRLAVAACGPNLQSKQLTVIDLKTGAVIKQLPFSDGWAGPVEFAADGKRALVQKQGCVTLCNMETGQVIWAADKGTNQGHILSGNQHVLVRDSENRWCTLDVATGKVLRTMEYDGKVWKYAFRAHQLSPDGVLLVGAVGENVDSSNVANIEVHVWHLGRRGASLTTFRDPTRVQRT